MRVVKVLVSLPQDVDDAIFAFEVQKRLGGLVSSTCVICLESMFAAPIGNPTKGMGRRVGLVEDKGIGVGLVDGGSGMEEVGLFPVMTSCGCGSTLICNVCALRQVATESNTYHDGFLTCSLCCARPEKDWVRVISDESIALTLVAEESTSRRAIAMLQELVPAPRTRRDRIRDFSSYTSSPSDDNFTKLCHMCIVFQTKGIISQTLLEKCIAYLENPADVPDFTVETSMSQLRLELARLEEKRTCMLLLDDGHHASELLHLKFELEHPLGILLSLDFVKNSIQEVLLPIHPDKPSISLLQLVCHVYLNPNSSTGQPNLADAPAATFVSDVFSEQTTFTQLLANSHQESFKHVDVWLQCRAQFKGDTLIASDREACVIEFISAFEEQPNPGVQDVDESTARERCSFGAAAPKKKKWEGDDSIVNPEN